MIRRSLCVVVAAAGAFLQAAAPSLADSRGTITELRINGSAVAGQRFSFTVDSSLADPSAGSWVSVAAEAPGAGCPAAPADYFYANGEDPINNPFPITDVGVSLSPGQYVLCAWLSNPANASDVFDSRSVPFTVGSGGTISLSISPVPADYTPLKITATGTTDVAGSLDADFKPARPSAACSATPQADSGTFIAFAFGGTNGTGAIAAGQYSISAYGEEIPAGNWLICEWLLDASQNVIATASRSLMVAPFHGTISLPAPFQITAARRASVPVAFHLNAPRRLWMTVSPTLASCAPSFNRERASDPLGEPGFDLIGTSEYLVPGSNTEVATLLPNGSDDVNIRPLVTGLFGQLVPGRYRICAWLANDNHGAVTDVGPVSTTVTVPSSVGSGSGGRAPIPTINGYDWRIDAAHVLWLTVWTNGRAAIVLTLYRYTGHRRHTVATLTLKGRKGVNHFVIRRWHGHRLGSGRFAISMWTKVGKRRGRRWNFSFQL